MRGNAAMLSSAILKKGRATNANVSDGRRPMGTKPRLNSLARLQVGCMPLSTRCWSLSPVRSSPTW